MCLDEGYGNSEWSYLSSLQNTHLISFLLGWFGFFSSMNDFHCRQKRETEGNQLAHLTNMLGAVRRFACSNNLKLHNSHDVYLLLYTPNMGLTCCPATKSKRLKKIVPYKALANQHRCNNIQARTLEEKHVRRRKGKKRRSSKLWNQWWKIPCRLAGQNQQSRILQSAHETNSMQIKLEVKLCLFSALIM